MGKHQRAPCTMPFIDSKHSYRLTVILDVDGGSLGCKTRSHQYLATALNFIYLQTFIKFRFIP